MSFPSLSPSKLWEQSSAGGAGKDARGLWVNIHPAQAAWPLLLKDSGKCAWKSRSRMPIPCELWYSLEDMRPKASQQEGEGLQEALSPGGALECVVIEAEKP